jgi:uncharacterized protein
VFNFSLFAGLALLLQGGALQIPAPAGLVNDFAHVLSAQTVQVLTQLAQSVRKASPGEMAIVTLPDLKGRPVSEVSLDIGRQWKVGNVGQPGDPTRNAGVVILIVPKETNSSGKGECRVEVGRGAEGYITDSDAGDMCRAAVSRYFRRGDYSRGTALVAASVAQAMAQEYHFSLDSAMQSLGGAPVNLGRGRPSGGIPAFVWFILLIVVLSMLGGGRRRGCSPLVFFLPWGMGGGRRGGWGGGGGFGGGFGGGGFGGFGGGGGFSGGGGGSSW